MPESNDMLHTYLAARDVECPGCSYNLRDLTGTRCPECNQELVLRVGLAEPHLRAYLGAMCGLLTGIGMAGVFLVLVVWLSFNRGGPPRSQAWTIYGIPSVSLVILSLPCIMLARNPGRVWFRAARADVRVATVVGCWGLTAAAVIWFLWSIFR
jgi:hypothetical protein